jgi:DMSO/TMAO reductase YedYZ molybdopterin-dependent catalytic subunit
MSGDLVRFPEKTDLILLTDRPPQLETPLSYFHEDLTPNEAFFVRWHLANIPTKVSPDTFELSVSGHVDNELSLSLDDLHKQFEPVSVVAVNQCSGNSRKFFSPRVPGGQWGNGAMGNARWTGVRLSDLLKKAAVKAGAVEVSFAGLDRPPQPSVPSFVKSLAFDRANDGEVLVAYEMNGKPLPMLNGYPLRLVVPGWFATYWVKSLSEITVLKEKFHGFWMDKAYRRLRKRPANWRRTRCRSIRCRSGRCSFRPSQARRSKPARWRRSRVWLSTAERGSPRSKSQPTAGRPGPTPASTRRSANTPGVAGATSGPPPPPAAPR